jgi:hypothetical protein
MAADGPNPWEVLHDDAKTYITLGSALLGISATFADRLLSDDDIGRWIVIAGWGVLAASIFLSIYASGTVFGELKKQTPSSDYNSAARFLNTAVMVLLIGVVLLAIGAWRTSYGADEPDTPSPISTARSTVAEMSGVDDADLTVVSVEETRGDEFEVLVEETTRGTTYEVTVDDGEATSVRTL